jgi:hypothetical protein
VTTGERDDQAPRVTFVRAEVIVGRRTRHDVGWLPSEGWFCTTCANTRCRMIRVVRDVVAP